MGPAGLAAPGAPTGRQRADFVIVTALEEERNAVLSKLAEVRRTNPSGDDIRNYYATDLPVRFPEGDAGTYRVVVTCLPGMGRVQATSATADAIRRWHPRYVILVGIAGGIAAKGVRLGDVLVSEQVVDYALQKQTIGGDEIRWEVHQADQRLVAAARDFTSNKWQLLTDVRRPVEGTPQRHIGPVASGDKVIAVGSVLAKYREPFPTLLGVEMEAAGVATACFQTSEPPGFFMVRGVSDLADEHKDSLGVREWRSYACDIAAAYAIELLKSGPVPEGKREELETSSARKHSSPQSTVGLPELLLRSGRAAQSNRTALCIQIGVDPNTLEFLSGTAPQAFAQELVFRLKQTGNSVALEKLCIVLWPAFQGGEFESALRETREKLAE